MTRLPILRRRLLAGLAATLVLSTPPAIANGGPRQAIEKLENCAPGEKGCVKILKQRHKGKVHEVKAQIRGGRIIWYDYDPATQSARRLN